MIVYTQAEAEAAASLGYKETEMSTAAQPYNRFKGDPASEHTHIKRAIVDNIKGHATPGPPTKFPTARYHQGTGVGVVVNSEEELAALGETYGETNPGIKPPPPTKQELDLQTISDAHDVTHSFVTSLAASHSNLLEQHAKLEKDHADLQKSFEALTAQVAEMGQQMIDTTTKKGK